MALRQVGTHAVRLLSQHDSNNIQDNPDNNQERSPSPRVELVHHRLANQGEGPKEGEINRATSRNDCYTGDDSGGTERKRERRRVLRGSDLHDIS